MDRTRVALALLASVCTLSLVISLLQGRDAVAQPFDGTPTPALGYLPSLNLRPPPTATLELPPRIAETATALWATKTPTGSPTATLPPGVMCENVLLNGNFESQPRAVGWIESSGRDEPIIREDVPHSGRLSAVLGGYPNADDSIVTSYTIVRPPTDQGRPGDLFKARLNYAWRIETDEAADGGSDYLVIFVRDPEYDEWSESLDSLSSNLWRDTWRVRDIDVTRYFGYGGGAGESTFGMAAFGDDSKPTTFVVDDVMLEVCYRDAGAD